MTDIERIMWGAFAGVAVFIIGQLISKFLIEPAYELRKIVGEVRFNLSYYRATIHTPIGRTKESSNDARNALMKSSCDIIARLHAVPVYPLTRTLTFFTLPKKYSLELAAVRLRGLSTYIYDEDEKAHANIEAVNSHVARIESLLRLKPLE
jgi:hypothetical protein